MKLPRLPRPRRLLALAATLLGSAAFAVDPPAAATATNTLGLDLFQHLASDRPGENLLLSPLSIENALALAAAGAAGETKTEMARVLHLPADAADVAASFATLHTALDAIAARSRERAAEIQRADTSSAPDAIEWHLANRLFGQRSYAFRETFLTQLRDDWRAPFEELDFRTAAEASRAHINAWVENQTARKIRDLIPAGGVGGDTRLVLVNALYLKAPWQNHFEPVATRPQPFTIPGRGSPDVPTMVQTEHLGYTHRDGYTAVALPYEGGELQFLILLPDAADGADALARRLTPQLLADCATLPIEEIVLHLPKFRLAGETLPLATVLQSLGMKSAFDVPAGSANFDGIAPRRADDYLALSAVFHQAFVEIDEHGTEASAATAVTMVTLGMALQQKPPPVVRVDRPFLFAIQHRASGTCLFLGRVTDPR